MNFMTIEETPKQADKNVASLIARITGDSKEVVVNEIRKYLIGKGELEILETSVFGTLQKLIDDIRNGKVTHMCSDRPMTEKRTHQVITILENDLRLIKKL